MASIDSSPLGWLVPYKLDSDNRDPVLVVAAMGGATFGILLPSISFWLQVFFLVALQSLISALLSIWTYTLIIQHASPKSSVFRFWIGYGVLIPLWLFLPRLQLQVFGITNMVMNFCLSGIIPTLNIFHTMEAMYDCVPSYAAQSPVHYALYCGSPMTLLWDAKSEKYCKATRRGILRHVRNFVVFTCLVGLLQSLLTPFSQYQPFYEATTQWYDVRRLFHIGQVGNNILHALLFQMYIVAFCEGLLAATALIFGKQPETVMENPMLESTSPSEFWGKRWNKLVQGVLKRGVYIPVRKANLPKWVAVLATFLASSLFHEWILTNLFYNVDDTKYIPDLGGSTAFLLWNGVLLILESILCDLSIFQWMKNNLPNPVRTFLVIMLGVPVAHCFCDAYVHSDFFRHGQLAFPMILPIDTQ